MGIRAVPAPYHRHLPDSGTAAATAHHAASSPTPLPDNPPQGLYSPDSESTPAGMRGKRLCVYHAMLMWKTSMPSSRVGCLRLYSPRLRMVTRAAKLKSRLSNQHIQPPPTERCYRFKPVAPFYLSVPHPVATNGNNRVGSIATVVGAEKINGLDVTATVTSSHFSLSLPQHLSVKRAV